MSNKCIYYVEGPCEQQLVVALKENPSRLIPGKIKVYNVIQNLIPRSQILSIQAGTMIALVFDTDVKQTANLKKNIECLRRFCRKLHIVYLPQVRNLEDELVRCTDVRDATALTQSNSISNFKTAFCRLRANDCRAMLKRHRVNIDRLWTTKVPEAFAFVESNSGQIKVNGNS